MARLPTVGGDRNVWGQLLNEKLDELAASVGKSAYQIAVDNGFEGSESEWLADLKGDKGDPGAGAADVENDLDAAGGHLLADGQVTAYVYGPDGLPLPAANALLVESFERDDISLGGGAVDSVNGQTGAVTLDLSGVNLFQALDIWPAVNNAALGIGTYSGFISYIDTQLSGEDVTKAKIGTAEVSGEDIWAYTFGADGLPHALIVSGLHGAEGMGWHAAMRFFLGFVTDPHPVMAALRDRVKITWVAHANPGSYLSERTNPNGVDLNRNFEFLNGLHPGSWGADQDEMLALVSLIADNPIALVIDCHTEQLGIGRDDLVMHNIPAMEAGVNRSASIAAVALFEQLYNPDGTYTVQPYYDTPEMPPPALFNWAAKYMRYDLNRPNAVSMLIDNGRLLAGSTNNTNSTQEAMRLYCGMIHLEIVTWLTQGQQPDVIPPYTFTGARLTADHETAIASGGTLINSTTAAAIQFDEFSGYTSTKRGRIRVTLRTPGYFIATTTLTLEGDAAAAADKVVELTYAWGDPTNGVATLTAADTKAYAYVPPSGGRITLQHSLRLEPTASITDNRFDHELRPMVRILSSTSDPVKLLYARTNVTHIPTDHTSGFVPVLDS